MRAHDIIYRNIGPADAGPIMVVRDVALAKSIGGIATSCERTPLDPRNDLRNHSPAGFQCGYGGSGPGQLALAILCDATGDDRVALRNYMNFKFQVIARLKPTEQWELSRADVLQWLKENGRP